MEGGDERGLLVIVELLARTIGRLAAGMARQGYDLQLTRYGTEGWRATFFPRTSRPSWPAS